MCSAEPENSNLRHAIIVNKKESSGWASSLNRPNDQETVEHPHDSLANVLYEPLELGYIRITCAITGQSRDAPEGV